MHWHTPAHTPIQSRCLINACWKWLYKYIYKVWNLSCQKAENSSVRKKFKAIKNTSIVCNIRVYDTYYVYIVRIYIYTEPSLKKYYQIILRWWEEDLYKKGRFKKKSCLNLLYCFFAEGVYSEHQKSNFKVRCLEKLKYMWMRMFKLKKNVDRNKALLERIPRT